MGGGCPLELDRRSSSADQAKKKIEGGAAKDPGQGLAFQLLPGVRASCSSAHAPLTVGIASTLRA